MEDDPMNMPASEEGRCQRKCSAISSPIPTRQKCTKVISEDNFVWVSVSAVHLVSGKSEKQLKNSHRKGTRHQR